MMMLVSQNSTAIRPAAYLPFSWLLTRIETAQVQFFPRIWQLAAEAQVVALLHPRQQSLPRANSLSSAADHFLQDLGHVSRQRQPVVDSLIARLAEQVFVKSQRDIPHFHKFTIP